MAKPAYASTGASVPESTAAASARIDAVRMGNALTTTAKIAATNSAKRCHAWTARPSGTGETQMTTASASVARRAGAGGFRRPAALMAALRQAGTSP